MKPPKPYSPLNHCDKCNFDYPHYNSSFTKCPRCEEIKQLKGNEKDITTWKGTSTHSKKPEREGYFKYGKFATIKNERAGRKVRKLTSQGGSSLDTESSKKVYRITKVSSKQQAINNAIATLKKNRIARLGSFCEACGKVGNVFYCHVIPKSLRLDLQLHIQGAFLGCQECDYDFEHFKKPEKVLKFKNLDFILSFLKENDTGRYMHVCDLLKIEYDLEQLQDSR